MSGLAEKNNNKTIVDAWMEGEVLVLLSPAFERLRVPSTQLMRFVGGKQDRVADFELDQDGRFLYWPHSDAHMGWKQLEQLVDPAASLLDQKKNEIFKVRYGRAIKEFREEHGLRQTDIPGITDRQLRRIEQGEQFVSTKTLEALARAHRMDVNVYLQELAQRLAN